MILRRSFSVSVVLFLVAAVSAGCGGSPTTPTAPFSQSDVRVGTGASAASGNTLSVNYTGWIYDASQPEQKGAKFESSIGSTPLSFVLGAGQVIPGWDQGIPGMRVGGLRRLVIPPSLAYGGTRNGPIPPNATLVFEVELLSVE
ncbi:MAG TPA: FKBP-type peptidyl-prolyl cis-trans isomerase [Vicinamibacterales bacterium]|nr:FKBP-type peptidyl-prolyl cis-trans isomerase [Vicinamibacterales bacterium]